ncbi:MAG: FAD:protein FMN transferase [Gammaproteobacteria bacterium]|nr:FAD:protein FMN transferase [Gammaproteobacteria bacterium]
MRSNIITLLISLLLTFPVHAGWYREEAAIMGTAVSVELWSDKPAEGRALTQSVLDEMRRIDRLMSTWRADSEISRVNAQAASRPVTVSRELLTLIERALAYSVMTDGAFDITYASAGKHYDYRAGKKPDPAQLSAALPAIDYRHVSIDKQNSTIRFLREGVRIDLGGIAKGYAVDRCIELLAEAGITHALVSAGGDTRVMGKRWQRPWQVGIRDPRNDGIVSMIPLEDAAISTSGDYERYFDQDGVRYHHILNPGTGDSAREVHSASIIGSHSIDTDALSTSVFVLGVEKGLALINRTPDTEAIIIDNRGLMHYSDGLARVVKNNP